MYCELFDTLNRLEHSLVQLGGALDGGPGFRQSQFAKDAAIQFENNLLKLNQTQEHLLLLGTAEAHTKLLTLYIALSTFHPSSVIGRESLENQELLEIGDRIKFCKREVTGRNGELAFIAQRDLGVVPITDILLGPVSWLRKLWQARRNRGRV